MRDLRLRTRSYSLRIFKRLPIVATACLIAMATGCQRSQTPVSESPAPTAELTILTPHAQAITNAFGYGFSQWYLEETGERVAVKFIRRGAPECLRYLENALDRTAEGSAAYPDVFFGGGIADHEAAAARSYSAPIKIDDALEGIPTAIGGVPTRDDDGHWFGTGLSHFGILYNKAVCDAHDIAPPQSWADLADARFAGWIGLARPTASGSARESLLRVIQSAGWVDGWDIATQILANTRGFSRSSEDALNDVAAGIAIATVAVNSDGQRRAAESDGRLVFVAPESPNAPSPDVISVLGARGTGSLGEQFVRYVLSDEGQLIWGGNAKHNPVSSTPLYFNPIKPSVYDKHADSMAVAALDYATDGETNYDIEAARNDREKLLALIDALSADQHVALQSRCRALRDRGDFGTKWHELVALPTSDEDRDAAATAAAWSEALSERLRKGG